MASTKNIARNLRNTNERGKVTSPHPTPYLQRQYLTVPTTHDFVRSDSEPQLVIFEKSSFCWKACSCIAGVFLFCIFTVFVYAVLISKYNAEPNISNDSLLASMTLPR